jgi:hypothetical protein
MKDWRKREIKHEREDEKEIKNQMKDSEGKEIRSINRGERQRKEMSKN